MTLNEDYTANVLKGLPIFLTNREWFESTTLAFMKIRYGVLTANGYIVSIVEFHDKMISLGHQYEMLVIEVPSGPIDQDLIDVQRGSAIDIHNYLLELENE